jgi:membrane protease YdiL (CAAX protease family)
MLNSNNGKLTWFKISIYYIIFFIFWCVRELIIRHIFLDSLNDITFQIMETIIKLLLWTLPAIILIKIYQNDMWVNIKEMFTNKPKWFERKHLEKKPKWYEFNLEKDPLILYMLILLLLPLRAWLSFGELTIHRNFQPIKLIEIVLFVGITEEIVFRGWLLNSFIKKLRLWPAIFLNSILFLIIHFPIWIYFQYNYLTILSSSLGVLGISIILCILYIKSKNILVPIIFHMAWNLLIVIFNGMPNGF